MGVFAIFTKAQPTGDLGGELPPVDPGGTPEWVSIFDNTVWEPDTVYNGSGVTVLWDAENSRFSVEEKSGGSDALMIPKGNWASDFRPDKIRVTLVDGTLGLVANFSQVYLKVGGAIDNNLTASAGNTIHTSDDLAGATLDDLDELYLQVSSTSTTGIYYITDIEFYYDSSNPPDSGGAWTGGEGGEGG